MRVPRVTRIARTARSACSLSRPVDSAVRLMNVGASTAASFSVAPRMAYPSGGGSTPSGRVDRAGLRLGSLQRRVVPRHVDRPALADHGHLDLPGILELILDLPRDLVGEENGGVVVDVAGPDDHADLAAGLKRVHLLDAGLARRQLFEGRETLDVVL